MKETGIFICTQFSAFFALFDCVNYLRWCSLYLEDMRRLPGMAPGIYQAFLQISVKDTERSRRSTMKPIEVSIIAEDTPLPVNMDTFWASVSNKAKLQMFLRKGVIENAANMCPDVEIVFSCFRAKNMLLPCQSLTEGCLMS